MKQLFTVFLFLNIWSANCQITEEFSALPLAEVFDRLDKKYGIKISYDPALIEGIKCTALLKDVSKKEGLKLILKNTQLSFLRVKSNYYSLQPSKVHWKISGYILDPKGIPLPFAKLRVRYTNIGTHSNDKGFYSFDYASDLAPEIEITVFGHYRKIVSAALLKKTPNIKMRQNIVDYPEVLVEYLTEGIYADQEVSALSIRPKELGALPGTTEPDVFQLVQSVPGINSASSTVNEIQIRGGTADQNRILWDGIPIYHPGHFNGMISSINPNIVHQANLHRGTYSPYYGGKVSGLMDLHSIDFIPNKFKANASVNMLQADAFIETPLSKKTALLLSFRRSYMDLWKSPTYKRYAQRVYQETAILSEGEYGDDPDFDGESLNEFEVYNEFIYSDINGKFIYKPSDKTLFTFSGMLTNNQLNYSQNVYENQEELTNDLSTANYGFSTHLKHKWNERWSSDLLASFARYNYQYNFQISSVYEDITEIEEYVEKSNVVLHSGLNWSNSFLINAHNIFAFGYQFKYNSVNYGIQESEDEDTFSSLGDNSGVSNVLHLNYTHKKGKWLAKLGARGVYMSAASALKLEPRAYLQYSVSPRLSFKTSFGLQNQFISQIDQLDEQQLGLSNRVWVMVDGTDIPIVGSRLFDLGAVFKAKGWYVELEAYRKDMSNIVMFSDDIALSSGLARGDGISRGIDLLVKKRWKNYRTWVSYSLSEVQYNFEDLSEEPFFAPFNQTHTLKWGSSFKWRGFEFSSAFKIASGKAYTPLADVAEELEPGPDPSPNELYNLVYGSLFSRKLPLFHQLDLTVMYNVFQNPDRPWQLKIGVSFFNVYNQVNVLNRTYDLEVDIDDPDNPLIDAYAIDKYYLGFTPNAVIRIDFK